MLAIGLSAVLATTARADLTNLQAWGDAAVEGPPSFTADHVLGNYTITAGGADFWDRNDQGAFLYDPGPVSGDFTAVVRAVQVINPAPTWGRDGLMARSLDPAGPNGESSAYRATIRETGGPTVHQRRSVTHIDGSNPATPGGDTGTAGLGNSTPPSQPLWLSLSRYQDRFISQFAVDVAGVPGPWSAPYVEIVDPQLQGDVYVGLAHQAHDQDNAGRVNTGVFESYGIGPLNVPQLGAGAFDNMVRFSYVQQPDGTWNRVELWRGGALSPPATYDYANAHATSVGGHLASIRSQAENEGMAGVMQQGNVWIGFDDIATEGSFTWVDDPGGPVPYTNWNPGEPNNAGGEHATEMSGQPTHRWNDLPNANPSFSRRWIVEHETNLAAKPALPLPAGFQGGHGYFDVREMRNIGPQEHVLGIEAVLYSGIGTHVDYQAPVINMIDPGFGSDHSIGGGTPFATNTPGDDNDIGIYARGTIRIEEAGDYTFGFRGDDGALLRIHGATFSSSTKVNGANFANGGDVPGGVPNAHRGNELYFPQPTGDAFTLGVANLAPGDYPVEFLFYENGGGASVELFAAAGAHTSFNNTFRLIGQPAVGPALTPPTLQAPFATGASGSPTPGWDVARRNGPSNLNDAIAAMEQTFADPGTFPPDAYEVHPVINFADDVDGGGNLGFPDFPQVVFPGNTPGVGENNFAIGAITQMTIADEGLYRFTVLGDDGSRFRIAGTAGWTAGGIAQVDGSGAGILIPGCCADGWGEVFLTPGTYDVDLVWNEIGGGAYVSVRYDFNGRAIGLLGSAIDGSASAGLELVPEPSSVVLGVFGAIGLLAGAWKRRRKA